ncbi:MAG: tryptophan-rich sensory protein, partial [Actinobacteria bacterium]|nr:tryptophan-rich sensory protein [Actinomycetota bacterium]
SRIRQSPKVFSAASRSRSTTLSGRDRRRSLQIAAGATGVAAVVGNAFIGRDALGWFRSLRRPRGMPSKAVFMVVGFAYYLLMGTVLYRALRRHDRPGTALSLTVLAGNELWNFAFFGRRSARNGFAGTAVFLVPLSALFAAVREDPLSRNLVGTYGAWVAYDVWWTYTLWRLNPTE